MVSSFVIVTPGPKNASSSTTAPLVTYTLGFERPPFAPRTRLNPITFVLVGGVTLLALALLNNVYASALTTTMVTAMIGLSVVVVTGYLGQISFAQMAFAGAGAFAAAKFATSWGIPFPWPIPMAAVCGALAGVVIGLPALRVRGLNLAVVTLGFAVAASSMVFENPAWNDGSGVPTGNVGLWGWSVNPNAHPFRFGAFALVVLGMLAVMVINLRRSPMGQRMLAVRSNERSAAAAGINVPATKLQGFALSAAIAAVGGAIGAYQLGSATPDGFDAFASITIVTLVYIGGVACVSGAMIAGVVAAGGIVFTALSGIGNLSEYWVVISGVVLVATALTQPDGAAVAGMQVSEVVSRRLRRDTASDESSPTQMGDPPDSGGGAVIEAPVSASR